MSIKSKVIYCKRCGREAIVNPYRDENYLCDVCKNLKWFKKMGKLRCSVISHKNLGDTPIVSPRAKDDYPKITVDGIEYIDTTDYFFEDTKYKKEYLSQQEKARREKQEQERLAKEIAAIVAKDKFNTQDRRESRNRQVKKLYRQGYDASEIAVRTGVARSTVAYVLKDLLKDEQEVQKLQRLRRDERIEKMYKEGRTYRAIAGATGYSKATVSMIIRKLIEEGRIEGRK